MRNPTTSSTISYSKRVELFTLSSWEWQEKQSYSKVIRRHSILAVEKKFILFGGESQEGRGFSRKVLTNYHIYSHESISSFVNYCRDFINAFIFNFVNIK